MIDAFQSRVDLRLGDSLEVLKGMYDNSVDSVVTDPPYGIAFMGKKWDHDVPKKELWAECLRVLKPGGHLLSFFGSRTYHRGAVEIENAGFEIRDQIMWVYGSGFPKSMDVGKAIDKSAGADREVVGQRTDGMSASAMKSDKGWNSNSMGPNVPITAPATPEAKKWDGWGTALKPAHEPLVVARKPLNGTVAANFMKWGVGGLNIEGCRVAGAAWKEVAPNAGGRSGGVMGNAAQHPGGKPHEKGRFPANLIHDGSQAVLDLFPQTGAGHHPKSKITGFGEFGGGDASYEGPGPKTDKSSAARFFYCAKPGKKERDAGLDGLKEHAVASSMCCRSVQKSGHGTRIDGGELAKRKNMHPTVKPVALMRYLCRLVTPPGGLVLDPFMGSGTTGIAALQEGFAFVGIEREAEYLEISRARIAAA